MRIWQTTIRLYSNFGNSLFSQKKVRGPRHAMGVSRAAARARALQLRRLVDHRNGGLGGTVGDCLCSRPQEN